MSASVTMEDFETLLNESFELDVPKEGSVVKGTVIAIEAGQAIIDIGFKMEGRVELKEFANPGEAPEINVDDKSVLILVREFPMINKISIEGNDLLDYDKIIDLKIRKIIQKLYLPYNECHNPIGAHFLLDHLP